MHQHNEHCDCGGHDQGHSHSSDHHEHNEHCGCEGHDQGHSHSTDHHEHNEHCGCEGHDQGHSHSSDHHEHNEHCGCGHTHAPIPTTEGLSPIQVDILLALRQRGCLPVACFTLSKTDDNARHGVALAPVYLSATDDSMEQVKQLGQELSRLEGMDLLTLDYDLPLQNYPYDEYRNSALYAYFVQTVAEAAMRPEATYDTPGLDLGSMALTDVGEEMVDKISKQLDI